VLSNRKFKEETALFNDKYNYLQVYFTRPPLELVEEDERYRYIVFSHVGLLAPYFASIYEVTGQGLAIAQVSADKYLPENSIRIVLFVKLEDSVRKVLEKHLHGYGYCVPYVVNVLKELGQLPKHYEAMGVDELYNELEKYKFTTDFIKHAHKKQGDRS